MAAVDVEAVKAWTEKQEKAARAYRSQPLASNQGGPLPCLNDCGRKAWGKKAHCRTCIDTNATRR